MPIHVAAFATAAPTRLDADLVARFLAAIDRNDATSVQSMLGGTPELASASDNKGHSAFLLALFQEAGEAFVRPQDNAVLDAIVARHPALDPIEAAAAGDQGAVDAELARDPGYVRRFHRIGWTPLHFAAFGGQSAIVTSLLAHGADPDTRARNRFDNTPLQVALLSAQSDVVRVLLATGVDVNARQGEGFTALHEAAQNGDAAVLEMLLRAGADVSVRGGKKNESALDLAVAGGHAEAVALLRARGAR